MDKRLLHTTEGVRDIYGEEYARKLAVEEKLQKMFHLFGYRDIQTPTFEFFDVFSKEIGTKPSRELYKFFDKEGNTLVLRPDFTPSIARCAAKYFMEENAPIRFCYAGNAFSNTSELQGKLKEVTQMGAELIGEPSVRADVEMIAMVVESLKNAGLTEFQVSVGQVEYFKGICEEAGLSEEMEEELREYISSKNYFGAEEFLIQKKVPECYRSMLLVAAELFGGADILENARQNVKNERSRRAVDRLADIYEGLKTYEADSYVSFDLGMLSKYHYYTGVIFKAYTYGVGEAVVTGGRYDRLLFHFGKDAAAIGFMIVVDSLMEALSRQKVPVALKDEVQVLSYLENDYEEALRKALKARKEGRFVALVPKEDKNG